MHGVLLENLSISMRYDASINYAALGREFTAFDLCLMHHFLTQGYPMRTTLRLRLLLIYLTGDLLTMVYFHWGTSLYNITSNITCKRICKCSGLWGPRGVKRRRL